MGCFHLGEPSHHRYTHVRRSKAYIENARRARQNYVLMNILKEHTACLLSSLVWCDCSLGIPKIHINPTKSFSSG